MVNFQGICNIRSFLIGFSRLLRFSRWERLGWGISDLLGLVLLVVTGSVSAKDAAFQGFEKFDRTSSKYEDLTNFLVVSLKDWSDAWQYIPLVRRLESGDYLLVLNSAPINAGVWYFDSYRHGLRRLSGTVSSIREIQSDKDGETLLLLSGGSGGGGIGTIQYDLLQIGSHGLARGRRIFFVESDMENGLCGRWSAKRIRHAGTIEKTWILESRMPVRLAVLLRQQDCSSRKIGSSVKLFNLTAKDWKLNADDRYLQNGF